MNNILEKVKQYFSSNFGKLDGIISILSFIVTLVMSVLYKNRIDISLLKALLSGIITLAILFLIGLLLKRYLGDIIESSNVSTNMDMDYNSLDDNSINNSSDDPINNLDNISNNTDDFNPDSITISPDSINLDRKTNSKPSPASSGGDIGDIVVVIRRAFSFPVLPVIPLAGVDVDGEIVIPGAVHERPREIERTVRRTGAAEQTDQQQSKQQADALPETVGN